eukprot:PITA_13898
MPNALLPGWNFSAIDSDGHSGGLAVGIRAGKIKIWNQWGMKQVLGIECQSTDFDFSLTIINIYGPCQGRISFWNDLLEKSFMKNNYLVMGGDLNFSLGRAEAWGPAAREDPQSDFFINALASNNLLEANLIKLKPTWRNRRVGEARVAKRLDRFLINEALTAAIPLFRQWVEEWGPSDHFPIFLELAKVPPKPPAPFKFNASWLQEESYNKLFQETWIHAARGSQENKGFLFMENLKRLKKATILWAKDRKLKQNEEITKISEELQKLESIKEDGYATFESKKKIVDLEKHKNQILLAKEEEWRLKSRAIWLKAGDKNTSFFHNYAKGRKSANTIWQLMTEEGREAKTFEALSSLGVNHFKSLFKDNGEITIAEAIQTAQSFHRYVEEEEADSLMEPVSKEEVEGVIKSMAKEKSPGPDGWSVELFLHFFEQIGEEITKVVEESRLKGEMYSPFNATFIALIPKKEAPETFEDFRPISLCNSIYKVIAKVIALRIKPILSRHISPEQFGFLNGRQIHEAIGMAQEVLHSVKMKNKKGAVIKIDLSKAYDRVNWSYIRLLLTHLGFKVDFISWIMGRVTDVSYAILINGAATPFFKGQKGLRQGCPLSPLLFLLVAEGLSQLIHKSRREGKIKGIEAAVNMFISHLLFVDDILVFTNGSINELKELKNIFELFLKATALTWVPKGVLEKIRRICSRFLWAGSKESSVLPWVAWEKVARPKEWGGWGIKSLPDFRLSLAAKSGWHLIKMENLWTRTVKRKYIDPTPLEAWIRNPVKSHKKVSAIWKATLESFKVIEQGLAWKVGNGEKVKIGKDPWIGCNENYALSPGLVQQLEEKGLLFLNQVASSGASSIWGQAWKNGDEVDLEQRWRNEWSAFTQELFRSNVRLSDSQDELIWAHSDSGDYAPKHGYTFLMSRKGWGNPGWWSKQLWKLKSPPKSKILFWCILNSKIPTWDILQARFMHGPGRCTMCKSEAETINHLFLRCPEVIHIWGEVGKLLNKKLEWEGRNVQEAWQKWWQSHPNGNLRNLPLIISWGIWIARNKSIFQDKSTPSAITASQSTAIFSCIPEPKEGQSQRIIPDLQITEGIPWAFFDGASQNNIAGAGLVIFESSSHVLKASVGLGTGSNNLAELLALKFLICWLIQRHTFSIQIYGDSQNVIRWVNGQSTYRNLILKQILGEILRLKSHFHVFSLRHIFSEKNELADKLSKDGLSQVLGSWKIIEEAQDQTSRTDQPPFTRVL